MSREDLADALDRTEEIHSPPKPNGAGTAALKFTPEQWEETNRLMELSPFARDHEIKAAARKLGCRVTTLRDVLKSLEHNNGDSVSEPDEERPRQRDEVAEIGQACELFCDADGVAYATVTLAGHRETWPVSSPRFRRYVLREYQRRHGRLAAGTALIEGIEGIAAIGSEGPVREVFVRIGSADGKIYLDLCRDDWKVVEVDAGGWRILKASPVPFLRPAGLRPLPLPSRDALGVARLRPLVNIPDEQEWKLYVLWLVGCFRPKGPIPSSS